MAPGTNTRTVLSATAVADWSHAARSHCRPEPLPTGAMPIAAMLTVYEETIVRWHQWFTPSGTRSDLFTVKSDPR